VHVNIVSLLTYLRMMMMMMMMMKTRWIMSQCYLFV